MNLLLIYRNASEMSLLAGIISLPRIEMSVQSMLTTRRFVPTNVFLLTQNVSAYVSVDTLLFCEACLLSDVVYD